MKDMELNYLVQILARHLPVGKDRLFLNVNLNVIIFKLIKNTFNFQMKNLLLLIQKVSGQNGLNYIFNYCIK